MKKKTYYKTILRQNGTCEGLQCKGCPFATDITAEKFSCNEYDARGMIAVCRKALEKRTISQKKARKLKAENEFLWNLIRHYNQRNPLPIISTPRKENDSFSEPEMLIIEEHPDTTPCPDCEGRGHKESHAPGCDPYVCSHDCPQQVPCETCGGVGLIAKKEAT